MPKLYLVTFVAIVFGLTPSCTGKKSPNVEVAKREAAQQPPRPKKETSPISTFVSPIRAILQDSSGNYWFGSDNEGISRFDGKSYTNFSVEDGLPDLQVRTIQEGGDGTIWIETARGISTYDADTQTMVTAQGFPGVKSPTPNQWKKQEGDLWFAAGLDTGVYRYDGQSVGYLEFPQSKLSNPDKTYLTTGIAKGSNGKLWVATYACVFGFDGKEITKISDETLGLHGKAGELHVRSILEDSQGRLWIGNNGIGVVLVDGDTTIEFSMKMDLVPANSQRNGNNSPAGTLEHVFAIEEDGDGNIWFGDRDTGAWKYDGKSMTNYSHAEGLPSLSIWDIYNDNKDQLLFALDNGKVYRFNGTSFEIFLAPESNAFE